MPIVKMTKNYLHDYVMTLFLANNKRPDPQTGDQTKPVILMGGGSRCFDKDTLVKTNNGDKKISELVKGDLVQSFNHDTQLSELKKVFRVFKNVDNTKKCYKITFKNGDVIKCTYDHEIFYRGRYICAKDLVSLYNKINNHG